MERGTHKYKEITYNAGWSRQSGVLIELRFARDRASRRFRAKKKGGLVWGFVFVWSCQYKINDR